MTISLRSITAHVVIAGIYNYHLPLFILYHPYLQQALQLDIVLYLVDDSDLYS